MKIPAAQLLVFLGMLLLIGGSTAGLLAWRLVGVLDLPAPWSTLGVGAVFAWIAMTLGGMILPRALGKGRVMDGLAQVAFVSLGLVSVVISGVVLRDLAWLAWDFLTGIPALAAAAGVGPSFDRVLLGSNLAIAVGSLALVGWGWRGARSVPAVRRVEVPIADLPPGLDGFRIAQLSDVHVGPTIEASWLLPVVQRANELRPDLVVITGDLVDGSVSDLADHVAPIAGLVSRHGTYFVTGNHEYYSGAASWIRHLRGLGVRTLLNEHVLVEHGGGRLLLAGVPDHDAARIMPAHRPDPAAALLGAPARDVTVLLAHQPRTATLAQGLDIDLQLSGHTHGGQIWPWMHLVWVQQPMVAGLRHLGDLLVYTSRGTGYWGPPVRLGAPAEITEIVLRPAAR